MLGRLVRSLILSIEASWHALGLDDEAFQPALREVIGGEACQLALRETQNVVIGGEAWVGFVVCPDTHSFLRGQQASEASLLAERRAPSNEASELCPDAGDGQFAAPGQTGRNS